MKLEIVTHCYRYPRLLSYQLGSLLQNVPTRLSVDVTVFYCPEDNATYSTLAGYTWHRRRNIRWRCWPLDNRNICRRTIGRNLAAEATEADTVWYTDCNVCFGPGCLDALPAELERADSILTFPQTMLGSRTRELGDEQISRVDLRTPDTYYLNPAEFAPRLFSRATGALQIVSGDYLRKYGYCSDPALNEPADAWQRTYEDRAFRHELFANTGVNGQPIDLPNLYWIRHTKKGRDIPGLEL